MIRRHGRDRRHRLVSLPARRKKNRKYRGFRRNNERAVVAGACATRRQAGDFPVKAGATSAQNGWALIPCCRPQASLLRNRAGSAPTSPIRPDAISPGHLPAQALANVLRVLPWLRKRCRLDGLDPVRDRLPGLHIRPFRRRLRHLRFAPPRRFAPRSSLCLIPLPCPAGGCAFAEPCRSGLGGSSRSGFTRPAWPRPPASLRSALAAGRSVISLPIPSVRLRFPSEPSGSSLPSDVLKLS